MHCLRFNGKFKGSWKEFAIILESPGIIRHNTASHHKRLFYNSLFLVQVRCFGSWLYLRITVVQILSQPPANFQQVLLRPPPTFAFITKHRTTGTNRVPILWSAIPDPMPAVVLRDVGVSTIAKHREVILARVTGGIATCIFGTLRWCCENSL